MKATEFIQKLQKLVDQHGDLDVEDSVGEMVGEPEFSESYTHPRTGESIESCFVVCDTA